MVVGRNGTLRIMFLMFYVAMSTLQVALASSSTYNDVYFARAAYQGVISFPCTTLLNGSTTVGCGGSGVGVLYGVADVSELDLFIQTHVRSTHYVVVTSHTFLDPDSVAKMHNTGVLAGIIVLADDAIFTVPEHYSPASACPNCYYGLYANATKDSNEERFLHHVWNTFGNGILDHHYPFPIALIPANMGRVYLRNVATAVANNVASKYKHYPLFAAQFDARMWATTNSQTCLRREWCTPVGGASVWATFSSAISPTDNKDIILLSTRIDSRAEFPDFAVASTEVMPSIAAWIAIAEAFSRSGIDFNALTSHIVFTFFDTESFGFSGSKRFIKDIIEKETCKKHSRKSTESCQINGAACSQPCFPTLDFQNITFNKISTVVEFDSIGMTPLQTQQNRTFFFHLSNPDSQFFKSFPSQVRVPKYNVTSARTIHYQTANTSFGLPPASAMSFLAKNGSIDSVIISDYDTAYLQPYYDSIFDSSVSSDTPIVQSTCALATSTLQAILTRAGASSTLASSISVDCEYLDEIFYCLSQDLSCNLLAAIYPNPYLNSIQKVSLYSGSFQYAASTIAHVLKQMMANFTAINTRFPNQECEADSDCDPGSTCTEYDTSTVDSKFQVSSWRHGRPYSRVASTSVVTPKGYCIMGQSRYHWSYAAGVEMDYDSGKFVVTDASLGAWTESTWDHTRLRLMQIQSKGYHIVQFFVGILVTLIALGILEADKRYRTKVLDLLTR